jgi:hypothetical protein
MIMPSKHRKAHASRRAAQALVEHAHATYPTSILGAAAHLEAAAYERSGCAQPPLLEIATSWGVSAQLSRDWRKYAAELALVQAGRSSPSGGGAQVRRARKLRPVVPSEPLTQQDQSSSPELYDITTDEEQEYPILASDTPLGPYS